MVKTFSVLCIEQTLQFKVCQQNNNRLNEQNLSIHNTLQSTKFTPLQCQLMKFCICAEFLGAKLSEKSNFETPEGVPTKAQVPTKICSYGNYG